MSEMKEYKSVEEYLSLQPEKTRNALIELRECIFEAAPDATELINYNIPAYSLIKGGNREHQIMIAGYAKHVGLYPHPSTMEKFDSELSEYKRAKGSVQFPLNKTLPKDLIVRMVKFRLELLTH